MAEARPLIAGGGNGSPGVVSNDFADVRTVGVIGAGVAGLQMTRALIAHGYEVKVYDRAPKVGGLWRENYHSYGVQVPKQFYEFPDFPFEAVKWGEYPTGPQTQAYIEAFANHYKLLPHINLNTSVNGMKPRTGSKKGWVLELSGGAIDEFDFVVFCTGMYSQVPSWPSWAKEKVEGAPLVMHSSSYITQDAAKNKRVLVIGAGKSAIDVVIDASEVAKEPPTLLFREAHWSTPRWIAGLIPFQFVFLSRLGQALVSWYKGPYPSGAPCFHTCLSWILFPIMWVAFRLVELIFMIQRGHWGSYYPKLDVVADFYNVAAVLDTTFINKWRSGKLKGKKGAVKRLVKGGVETEAGETIEVDTIICATGHEKQYFEPPKVKELLKRDDDGLYLYRQFIPPKVRDLHIAFCGCEVATISNIMTHGLHAEYICRVLGGSVALPSDAEMEAQCDRLRQWRRRWMPNKGNRANMVLLHQIHYHDQLLVDMGVNPSRKGCFLCEWFCPYMPSDYDGIIRNEASTGP